ncbi:MAG: CoA ester lyase [Microbacterium sp.]|uniref:HpcH/HpaI aldolase/citrate lyase family protein n=1 Tax=Microbacterium sp. TaxID=51671 RepID=UPI002721FA79|nr:CoA ester lyase [Microbacterium sp.]MDO8381490.1 CoA ester lyase [Microbacterium sp.]
MNGAPGSAVERINPVAQAVTALFVPGNRPERFAKAANAGADMVIIDLEDAVPIGDKERALDAVTIALASDGSIPVQAMIRINAPGSPSFDRELAALVALSADAANGLVGVVVPKAEDAGELAALVGHLPAGLPIVPLVETALGLMNCHELAGVAGVSRLAFGAIDFALDIDAGDGDRFLDYARSHLVVASRAANIAAPLDSPSPEIGDASLILESARSARHFGFGGKLCIHPAQLPSVKAAFTPSEESIRWARALVDAGVDGAGRFEGRMIDRPVIERANRILKRAELLRKQA